MFILTALCVSTARKNISLTFYCVGDNADGYDGRKETDGSKEGDEEEK